MIISVYGAGYVGLVSAVCLAKLGHVVYCTDLNEERIRNLKEGINPIYEDNLTELLKEGLGNQRLNFTSELEMAVESSAIHIIATGTPSLADGSADLSQVYAVVEQITGLTRKNCTLVIKSTVPVGTGKQLQVFVNEKLRQLNKKIKIELASNPEFLREGTAINDFLQAERVILGGEKEALAQLKKLYAPLKAQGIPLLLMSQSSAELTKYAANAMLACKISFINQMSRYAEALGANIDEVREGMAFDQRIGPHFLQPGIGYGGSCFPKDVLALAKLAETYGLDNSLLTAIDKINKAQKKWVIEQLFAHFEGEPEGLKIGIWGLSFKPGTDDLREASSLVAIKTLLNLKAKLFVFDPVAIPAAQNLLNEQSISWCKSSQAVLEQGLDALIIMTEWPEFVHYPLEDLAKKLKNAPLIDGRNCYLLSNVEAADLTYYSVGRPVIRPCKTQIREGVY